MSQSLQAPGVKSLPWLSKREGLGPSLEVPHASMCTTVWRGLGRLWDGVVCDVAWLVTRAPGWGAHPGHVRVLSLSFDRYPAIPLPRGLYFAR
jgi:hypothetical protein